MIVFLVLDFSQYVAQVEKLRRVKAATDSCVREDCRRAGGEQMLPEHPSECCQKRPYARRLREANAAGGSCVRDDDEIRALSK